MKFLKIVVVFTLSICFTPVSLNSSFAAEKKAEKSIVELLKEADAAILKSHQEVQKKLEPLLQEKQRVERELRGLRIESEYTKEPKKLAQVLDKLEDQKKKLKELDLQIKSIQFQQREILTKGFGRVYTEKDTTPLTTQIAAENLKLALTDFIKATENPSLKLEELKMTTTEASKAEVDAIKAVVDRQVIEINKAIVRLSEQGSIVTNSVPR